MNSDFVPVKDLHLSFAPGSSSGDVACANITIIGDTIPEADVSFTITAETINDADVVQGSNVATVVIEDDDNSERERERERERETRLTLLFRILWSTANAGEWCYSVPELHYGCLCLSGRP